MMEVEGKDSTGFNSVVMRAVELLDATLADECQLRVATYSFEGPHLTPGAGAYSPLDFLAIGLAEKLERRIHFLLIVTEVDLSSSSLAFTLALPSQLTNIGILSTKRLNPEFWGEKSDMEVAANRLNSLMLHTTGHLLNLAHETDRSNVMYPFASVEDLDDMKILSAAQFESMKKMLPREAHERSTRKRRALFTIRTLIRQADSIGRAIVRANPLRLASKMPTMLATALSVIVVLFFGAETWDVASAVSLPQVILFSIVSMVSAAFVLYRAFAFNALLSRDRVLTESTIVTAASTILSLFLTIILMFTFFGILMYVAIVTVFPDQLMTTWPTVGPATHTLDHFKLSMFLAAIGVLAGSLGGRSDSRELIRNVLFLTEES